MRNERIIVMLGKCHSVTRCVVDFHACAMKELSLSLTTFRTAFSFHASGPFLASFHYRLPKVTKVSTTVTNAPSLAAARGAHRIFNRCGDVMKHNLITTVVCPAICIACDCERNYAAVIINLFKIYFKYSLFALWTRFVRV